MSESASAPDATAIGVHSLIGTFLALDVLTVILRFYARKHQKVPWLTDDWLLIPGVITYPGAAICSFIGVKIKVFGYSKSQFTKAQIASTAEESSKLQVAIDVLTIICLACSKASALFFYRRVFCTGPGRLLNKILIASIVAVALWVVAFEVLTGFQCHTHFSALWDGTYKKYCTISFPFLHGMAISDVLLDVWILAIPIPLVLRLHTTPMRKVSIIGVFMLACVGLGASIARMVIYFQVSSPNAFLKYDTERMLTKGLYFMMLEAGISLLAVNLPSLWLIFVRVTPETILRSMRSVASLGSSRDSNRSKASSVRAKSSGDVESRRKSTTSASASSSSANKPGLDPTGAESHALCDVERPPVPEIPVDRILVKDSVTLNREATA